MGFFLSFFYFPQKPYGLNGIFFSQKSHILALFQLDTMSRPRGSFFFISLLVWLWDSLQPNPQKVNRCREMASWLYSARAILDRLTRNPRENNSKTGNRKKIPILESVQNLNFKLDIQTKVHQLLGWSGFVLRKYH